MVRKILSSLAAASASTFFAAFAGLFIGAIALRANGLTLSALICGLASLACLAVGIEKRVRASRAEQARQRAANEAARQAALQEFQSLSKWTDRQSWPNLNSEVSGVVLAESEQCVALSRGVLHIQIRKKTHYEGRTASVSVRVMKGVSVRSGGFAGRPVTTESREVADSGSIFVTDRRVVFAGTREVVEVPVKKLADARAEIGSLELLVANRANPLEFRLTEGLRAPYIAGVAKIMATAATLGTSHT